MHFSEFLFISVKIGKTVEQIAISYKYFEQFEWCI